MRRACLAALLTTIAALAVAPSAYAGIWTPVASGTTQDITAVDYRGPGDIVYATASGQILRNGLVQATFPAQFTDLAFNPAGDRGLATAANGKLYRWDGVSWSLLSLTNKTWDHTCPGSGGPYPPTTPTGNLNAVTWAAANTAYVVGADRGVVLKVEGHGGVAITDVSRKSGGSCRVDPGSDALTDIAAVTDQEIYMVSTNFGARRITTDAFVSSAIARNNSSVNCAGARSRLGIDLNSPNRSWVTGGCSGSLAFGFSFDSGTEYDLGLDYPNGTGSDLTGMNDVAVAGGSAVGVGNAGAILVSSDGRNAYFQRADGTEAGTDWLAVDKSSAVDAVVSGRGGKLIVSTQANAIPDVVAPAGTISGPARVTAGQPATFTANVADDAGGSGINPASFTWSATGVPAATGNPVALTFPSAGSYSLRVRFTDNAGNPGEATLSVVVSEATVPPPPLSTVKRTSATVVGGTVTLGSPRVCVPASALFRATLAFKRATRAGTKVVKVTRVDFFIDGKRKKIDRKAPFAQRLTVRGLKAGSTHTLRARAYLKVRGGKSPTKSISTTFTVCR